MGESRQRARTDSSIFDDPFFANSWDDFDRVRERMRQESRERWEKLEQDFYNGLCFAPIDTHISSSFKPGVFERMNKTSERETSSSSSSSCRRNEWNCAGRGLPDRELDQRQGHGHWLIEHGKPISSTDNQVLDVRHDNNKMEVFLDTAQYRPDELKVSIVDREVMVEGNHEEKAEDGTKMVSRQFVRKYTLPAGAKPEDVVSNLSSDGVLVVTANKSNPAIKK